MKKKKFLVVSAKRVAGVPVVGMCSGVGLPRAPDLLRTQPNIVLHAPDATQVMRLF